jgi:uncharacterized protein YndB with AHSA1/START domain
MTNETLTHAGRQSAPAARKARTMVERASDRELAVTRIVDGPARTVFEAWSRPELFQKWWVPKSCGVFLISFEADIVTGGAYRLLMGHPSAERPMAFFGRYIEVAPHTRLVWTNDEGGEDGPITTVAFEDTDGATRVVVHELYPSKEALEDAVASGSTSGWSEQFEQLYELITNQDAKV